MTIDKRIKFGGGGTMGKEDRGYQGGGRDKEGNVSGDAPGAARGGTGGEGENTGNTTKAKNTAPTKAKNLDVKEQYRVGTPTKLRSTIKAPDKSKVGKGSTQYNNYIDALNLRGETYNPVNIPAYIPGSTLINTAGNFLSGLTFDKNTQFFADNVAGKYGYGYGLEDYNQYMKDRTAGKVGAYGNENMGQNAINARSGGDNQGIMQLQYATPVEELNQVDRTPVLPDSNMYFNFGTFDDPIYGEDLISIEDLI